MTTIKEHNASTDEVIERQMTSDEAAALELAQVEAQNQLEYIEQKRQERLSIMNRLGLSESELKLLLG